MKARASKAKDAGIASDGAQQIPTEFRNTELGLLPTEWAVRSLGGLGQSLIGLTYDPQDIDPSGVLVLRSSNIGNNSLRFGDDVYVKKDIPDRIVARQDDLLICARNGSRPLIGKCALIDERAVGMTFGAFMSVFRSDDNRFVFHCFQSDIVKRQINEHLGATINQITNKSLNSFKIPYPEQPEREAIAEALSEMDDLVVASDALIAKKRAIKLGAMQQLLTGQKWLEGFVEPWERKRIGEFADCAAGGTPSTLVPSYWGGDILWMSSGELNQKTIHDVEGRITETGLSESSAKVFPKRCVLVGLAGQGKTRATVAINQVEVSTNQSIAAIFPNESFAPEYLYHNLDFRYDELRELSAGDGGRGGLNLSLIRSIEVPFPGIDEQYAIADILSDMDEEIGSLERRRTKTRAIKQGMMQELLTGRTRLI